MVILTGMQDASEVARAVVIKHEREADGRLEGGFQTSRLLKPTFYLSISAAPRWR
jgi:hypothetical protein